MNRRTRIRRRIVRTYRPDFLPLECRPLLSAMRPNTGFTVNPLPGNDDSSSGSVNIGFDIKFGCTDYTNLYVNNNGNITFGGPRSTYTPTGSLSNYGPIIAPFFADVDTRNPAEDANNPVAAITTYGNDTVDGHQAFGVNWYDVGYYSAQYDKLNTFQLVIINRSDVGDGAFQIEFKYKQI